MERSQLNFFLIAFLFFIFLSCQNISSNQYIGYINSSKNDQEGLGVFTVDENLTLLSKLNFIQIPSINYMVIDNNNKYIYTVSRNKKGGKLTTLKVTKEFVELVDEIDIPIRGACHITIDKTNKYLFISSYGDGTISSWRIKKNKTVDSQPLSLVQRQGKSINQRRQKSSHIHSAFISPDNKFILVSDLGSDEVISYTFNMGKLKQAQVFKSKLGGGPRHLAFSPNGDFVYVLLELSNEIMACSFDSQGKLIGHQLVSMLKNKLVGKSLKQTAAEIRVHPSGDFVYASNRGENSLSVFEVIKGNLSLIQSIPLGQVVPRNFNITPDGKVLVVGSNKKLNNYPAKSKLIVYQIDQKTGLLTEKIVSQWDAFIFRVLFRK